MRSPRTVWSGGFLYEGFMKLTEGFTKAQLVAYFFWLIGAFSLGIFSLVMGSTYQIAKPVAA